MGELRKDVRTFFYYLKFFNLEVMEPRQLAIRQSQPELTIIFFALRML